MHELQADRPRRRSRGAVALRIGSLAGGGALAAWGLKRRDIPGYAMLGAAGYLIYRGVRPAPARELLLHVSLTINRPPEEVFRFWRNFQNLPLFMSHLQSVRATSERFSEWKARGPFGASVTWSAEITDEKPNEWIVWRSLPGSELDSVGSVQFRPAPGNRGTEIVASLQYTSVKGALEHGLAAIFGRNPEVTIREDMRNFKAIMEAGEIPTIHGQSSGKRSALVSMIKAVAPDYRTPNVAGSALRTA